MGSPEYLRYSYRYERTLLTKVSRYRRNHNAPAILFLFFQGDGGFSKISRSLLLFRVDQHKGYSDDFNFLRCKVILYEIYAKENFA